MGIVATIVGGEVGHHIGKKVFGKGKSIKARVGRSIARNAGRIAANYVPILGSFKRGGRVKKTGAYLLHKGERVIPKRK
jgi:hypothetical protein